MSAVHRRTVALAVSWLAAGLAGCNRCPALEWTDVKQSIRAEFPGVRQLSTRELFDWLADESKPSPVLLDARTADEFAVSHLRGAQLASDVVSAMSVLKSTDPDTPVVVYCSVGYRSSQLAEELIARGYSSVFNLEGSLFQWANEGRPVYRDDVPVQPIHPYDARWGRLLDKRFRSRGIVE
jgi:rhodanese-related sulfurtransferase